MRRIHLAFGILGLLAFAATGRMMRAHIPPMDQLGDGVRLMYRSRHIYLLGSAVANTLLGLYLVPGRELWRWCVQSVGSILFLASTVLLGLAFLAEGGHGLDHTWRSSFGLYALFAGTLLHFVGAVGDENG
ncbi:MAG TPA: hypothetical protein VE377_07265 [Candidatus Dormibacteraeota bacterium]|nr:hypothetical protein [Candidatus Dormibacteraeota bacterium]